MYSSVPSALSFTFQVKVVYPMLISEGDLREKTFLTIHIQSRLQKYDCAVRVMLFPDIDKADAVVNETAR